MTIEEAYTVIDEWEEWEREECYCNAGNAPCHHCESQPSEEEDYDEANLIIEQFEKEMEPMNAIIIEMYPMTKDAVLVQKWFGEKISNEPLIGMLLEGKEAQLLEKAKRLEEEAANNRPIKTTG